MTDQEIYEGIVQQDNKTFLFLYNKYKGRIIGMVQKNSGSEEDALDIFQEGLIALWTNFPFSILVQSAMSPSWK